MRTMIAVGSLLVALTACGPRANRETGNAGTDTSITSTTIKDTTVVTADTSIDVDTVKKTDHADTAK